MPYRARANGNVLGSVPPSLVGVLYDEIPEQETAEDAAPAPEFVPTEPPKRKRGRPRKNPLPTE